MKGNPIAIGVILLGCFFALPGLARSLPWPKTPDKSVRACSDAQLGKLFEAVNKDRSSKIDGPEVSACKNWPGHPDLGLAAAAFRGPRSGQFQLVVGVWDAARGELKAWLPKIVTEDATVDFERLQIRLDTARYRLGEKHEGFGVDLYGGDQANCGDGELGAWRDMYAFDGEQLQLVAQDLILNTRTVISGSRGRCSSPNDPQERLPTVFQDMKLSMQVGTQTSHGLRDLLISETTSSSNGTKKTVKRYRLQFDGKSYRRG
jgi:hypothetical protein